MTDASRSAFRIVRADAAPFADIEAVFGAKGDPAHCWCQWYKIPGPDWRGVGDEALRQRLRDQLEAEGPGVGLLAYDGDEPVGWCAVEPRPNLPRLRRSTMFMGASPDDDFDDPGVWSVTCFVVPRAHRRRGVGQALAAAAVEHARDGGARALEAYAIDPAPKTPAAELFHGTVSMYAQAGFDEVARPSERRAVMQVRFS